MEITIEIQNKYRDRIVTALRSMKPSPPEGATDLQVFQYRVKEMIRQAVIRSEMKAAKEEIEEERRYGQAEAVAALNRQGLGGTTVLSPVIASHRKAAGQAKAAVEEGVQRYRTQRSDVSRQERMGFERQKLMDISRAREMRMGIVERREDIGPDPQMFSQMMGLYTARPGMFKTLTARRRGKLENIYKNYGVGNAPSMT